MPSPEVTTKLAILRQKSRDGTITLEEMREGIAILREDRIGASVASGKARTTKARSAASAAINSDELLAQLEGDLGL